MMINPSSCQYCGHSVSTDLIAVIRTGRRIMYRCSNVDRCYQRLRKSIQVHQFKIVRVG